MRFVVYGAGAIGGVVGGRLFQAGHDVVLVARGPHGSRLAAAGLRLDSPAGSAALPIPVAPDAAEVDWRNDTVVLVAVKSQDTLAVVEALAAHAPAATPLVSLQNGVANERVLLRRFDRVYGCCVMLPAVHLEPGVVQASSAPTTGILDLGRYPAGVDDVATDVAAALAGATFESVARPDIMRWKYRKLVGNLGNAVQALCGHAPGADAVLALLRAEAAACFAAAGIDVVSAAEDRARRDGHIQVRPVTGADRPGGSSWQSLARGTGVIETDYLNGEIALLGRLHGVPTPANAVVQRLANAAAHLRRPPGALGVDELLAAIAAG